MKKIVVSLCFIISMVMCGELVAQNNDVKEIKPTESLISPQDSVAEKKDKEWTNPVERFIGVWSLEKTVVDDDGKEKKFHPGTFMVVHPNASYTIFVHCDIGAVITSQGNIIIESSERYIEVISRHVNTSFIGISNRIDYRLDPTTLYKSFWVERDRAGGEVKRQVDEVWKRGTMPEIIFE